MISFYARQQFIETQMAYSCSSVIDNDLLEKIGLKSDVKRSERLFGTVSNSSK